MDPQEESEIVYGDTEPDHPILYIPKHLITLQTSCAQSDDIFINLNITAADTQGIDMNVYSGLCNIKVIDNTNDDHNDHDHGDVEMDYPSNSRNVLDETTLPDPNDSIETLRLSAPSPNVSNDCEAEENYTIYQSHNEHVTLRQHGSYVKKNVMHYSQYVQYSPAMEFEHKKFKRMKMSNEPEPQAGPSSYEEFEWDLSQRRKVMLADESRAREEMEYIDMPNDNVAVKQLTSSEVQGSPRQQQTIRTNDPLVKCRENGLGCNVEHLDWRLAELRRLADECRAIEEMKYEDMPDDNVAVKQLTSSEVQESPRQQRTISTNDPLVKRCENGSGYNVDHPDLRLAELRRLADECRAIDEMKYEDMPNDNVAVKQLTSSEVQESPRQQRTISTNDPLVKHCENGSGYNVDHADLRLAELKRLADECRAIEEMKYEDMPNDNVAVKQLTSSEVQGSPRQQRTISTNDPLVKHCENGSGYNVEHPDCDWSLAELRRLADENRAREAMKYVDMPNANVAVKQLMSSEAGSSVDLTKD
ncbi:uncharacterized protein [Maniola hyperantus]|uniref:uncharacterized protein isoform X2 n=1 Tax=Aphantopus hyperantus TaxID=2795564 RepID=UPI003747CB0A